MSTNGKSDLTRRDLVRQGLAGAALTGATLAGTTAGDAAPRPIPKKWDHTADVVCIGYGGAGACAAIEAHDAGAKVLILEKMAQAAATPGCPGEGSCAPPISQDAYTYISGLYEFSHSDMDKDLCQVLRGRVGEERRLDQVPAGRHGSAYLRRRRLPQGARREIHEQIPRQGRGQRPDGHSKNLWKLISYAVEEKRKIPVMPETPAKRLVTNAKGEVVGVVARAKGKEITIKARKAVVMTDRRLRIRRARP